MCMCMASHRRTHVTFHSCDSVRQRESYKRSYCMCDAPCTRPALLDTAVDGGLRLPVPCHDAKSRVAVRTGKRRGRSFHSSALCDDHLAAIRREVSD